MNDDTPNPAPDAAAPAGKNGKAGKTRGPGVDPRQVLSRYQLATMALTGVNPLAMVGFCTEMLREFHGFEGIMLANSVDAVVANHMAAKDSAKPGLVRADGSKLS